MKLATHEYNFFILGLFNHKEKKDHYEYLLKKNLISYKNGRDTESVVYCGKYNLKIILKNERRNYKTIK